MFARVAGFLGAGFLLGVFYASLFPLTNTLVACALGASLLLLVVAQLLREHQKQFLYAALCLCALVLGGIRYESARIEPSLALENAVGKKVILEGAVTAEPDVREGSVRLTVDISIMNDEPVQARALVIAPAYSTTQYGDTIIAEGKLKKPESFESGEGRVFNYPMYLAARGIAYQMSFASVEVVHGGGNPFVRVVLAIKSAYIRGLRAVLPEPYAGLAAGITAGDKRSVGSELSDMFQRVSLVHILVLSGYNITIVLGAFLVLLSRLARGKRLIVVLLTIAFFAVISGGAASALRAGAMAFAAVFAKMYGRQFLALRVLTAIVCAMVLWNPYLLVYDPGFQLSVLATLGLILFSSPIELRLTSIPAHIKLREIVAATIATQVTVLPLLLYSNGSLSIVAIPANLLALIAVPVAMAFSAAAALFGMLLGSWGTVFALPAYVLLKYIILVAAALSSVPYAAVSVPAFSPYILVGAYALIFLGYRYMGKRSLSTE